jgi:hypothetical protein
MTLSQSDLYTLAKKAGLPDSSAKVAAAIAMAESGGDPNVHNTNKSTGDDSYGLWQINMLGSMGPQRRKQFGILVDSQLIDPTQNAHAMASLSQQGRSFAPWTTYTTTDATRSYKRFMGNTVTDTGKDYNQSILQQHTGISVPDPLSGLASIGDATTKTAHWISDSRNWIRVGYVAGGTILVTGALIAITGDTKLGGLVMSATPPGRVGGAAKATSKVVKGGSGKSFSPGGAANI